MPKSIDFAHDTQEVCVLVYVDPLLVVTVYPSNGMTLRPPLTPLMLTTLASLNPQSDPMQTHNMAL